MNKQALKQLEAELDRRQAAAAQLVAKFDAAIKRFCVPNLGHYEALASKTTVRVRKSKEVAEYVVTSTLPVSSDPRFNRLVIVHSYKIDYTSPLILWSESQRGSTTSKPQSFDFALCKFTDDLQLQFATYSGPANRPRCPRNPKLQM